MSKDEGMLIAETLSARRGGGFPVIGGKERMFKGVI